EQGGGVRADRRVARYPWRCEPAGIGQPSWRLRLWWRQRKEGSMIAHASDRFETGLAHHAGTLPEHISPTAAKSYLACSLRFYFERVACLKKPTPKNLHLGKAVHA